MIPKDFYKHSEDYSLYTSDFNTEVYDSSPQTSSYRIDIRTNESNGNYKYHYKIFGLDGKLLTINGWTLKGASFSQAWNVNSSPMVNITDPQGICLDEYKIPSTFSKQEKNCGGEIENRLRETFSFMQYISQYQSLYDFKTVHDAALSNMENEVLRQ